MSQRNIIIILAVVAVIVLGGGFYLYTKNTATQKQATEVVPTDTTEVVPTLSPDDIGLTLKQSDSGKFSGHGVVMTITKLDGIANIDCEFSYIADTGSNNLPRGGICKSVQVKSADTVVKQEYPYGTCSDVCHFDKDISAVKMVVKVTKTDGKTYEVTQTL